MADETFTLEACRETLERLLASGEIVLNNPKLTFNALQYKFGEIDRRREDAKQARELADKSEEHLKKMWFALLEKRIR